MCQYLSVTQSSGQREPPPSTVVSCSEETPCSSESVFFCTMDEIYACQPWNSQFSAHSTRGASLTAALSGGATLQEVLKQADWSSCETFHSHYRPGQVDVGGCSIAVCLQTYMLICSQDTLKYNQ